MWTCSGSDVSGAGRLLKEDTYKTYHEDEPADTYREMWLRYLHEDPATSAAITCLAGLLDSVDLKLANVFNGSDMRLCAVSPSPMGVDVTVIGDSVSSGKRDSKSIVNFSLPQIWYMLDACDSPVPDAIVSKSDAQYKMTVGKEVIIDAVNDIMVGLQLNATEGKGDDYSTFGMFDGFTTSDDKKQYFNRALMLATYNKLLPHDRLSVGPYSQAKLAPPSAVRTARLLLRCVGYTSNRNPSGKLFGPIGGSDKIDLYQFINTSDPVHWKDSVYQVGAFNPFIRDCARSLSTNDSDTEFKSRCTLQYSNYSLDFTGPNGEPLVKLSCGFRVGPTIRTVMHNGVATQVYVMEQNAEINSCRSDGRLKDIYELATLFSE